MNQGSELTDQVLAYYEQGHSMKEIAERMGLHYSTVRRRVEALRWQKRLPRKKTRLPTLLQNTRLGTIKHVLDDLNDDDKVRLLMSVAADQTVAEYLATLVKEKFHGK